MAVSDFNSYGSRRGNHEVMMRGTFANIRLHNLLDPEKEGYYTVYLPTGEEMTIYDASMKYQAEGYSAAGHCRKRIWVGQLARLGRQRVPYCWASGRPRGEL